MTEEILKGQVAVCGGDAEYIFDIITDHSISLQNNITDNYLEKNTAVQDVIAKAPLTISVSGISGELVYTPPTILNNIKNVGQPEMAKSLGQLADKVNGKISPFTEKLGIIPALLPPVDNVTRLARDKAMEIEANIDRYINIAYNNLFKENKKTRLGEIFEKLNDWRNDDVPLRIRTPWGNFYNMYIQSVTLRQGGENYVTDIQLTLKQLNFAEIKYTDPDPNVVAQYQEAAKAEEVNCGKTTGVEVKHSMVKAFVHYLLK